MRPGIFRTAAGENSRLRHLALLLRMRWVMRTYFLALALAGAAATMSAQSRATRPSTSQQAAQGPDKALTLLGCVQRDENQADWFTLSDKTTGATYHLTGRPVRAYVWRNVRIVGGLVPSPNIAAQAGAIDPTKAAMASLGTNAPGAGNVEPLEFRVTQVRRLTGSCAPRPER